MSKANRRTVYKDVSILAVAFSAVLAAHGQSQPPVPSAQVAAPAFDVVSVKPNKSGNNGMSLTGVGESFKASNVTLDDLVFDSYDLTSDDLIFGLPGWARSDRFDIDAKIINPDMKQIQKLTKEQRKGMLLSILKDRFHLQAHLVTKNLPVYDLVIAKSGPKFTGSSESNKEIAAAVAKENLMNGGMMVGDGELTAGGVPVSSLAFSLTGAVSRTVIDKTGLTGNYNFELKWTPEHGDQANTDNGLADSQSAASSIFTALEEQLGLKLQAAKGPVQTLVVDHVEMPSEN